MKSKLILTLLFLVSVNIAFSQQRLSREQLCADADSLYSIINGCHPNIFSVMEQADFEKEFFTTKVSFKDSMTFADFYKALTPLIVKLGDGHTGIGFTQDLMKDVPKQFFPLEVVINKDSSLTTGYSYLEEQKIPKGSKILSINGESSKKIVGELLKYLSGEKVSFRLESLKRRFPTLMWIEYGSYNFTVQYLDSNNSTASIQIEGVDYSAIMNKVSQPAKPIDPYSLLVDDEKQIATIDFRSFSNPNRFQSFLDSAFTQIKNKNIDNLIIDIRENSGGNSALGDELFQYISPCPFKQFGKTTVKISPRIVKNLPGKDRDAVEMGLKTYNNNSLHELRENPLRYTGDTYLLTSNFTFSSAASFSWAFKYFKMGTIVGEETGGLAVSFGDVYREELPATGLSVGVSFKKFYSYGATDENTHGTIPDHDVSADKALEYTIKLIESL